MRYLAALLFLSLVTFAAAAATDDPTVETFTFTASDDVEVHADLHLAAAGLEGPILLLFHQGGGDGRGEYGPIVPRLLEDGFSVLVVDQRSGGSLFGGTNRTLAGVMRSGEEKPGYCDAYPDLVAALDWADERGFTGPVVAWGSSYSAALVLRLAAEHGERLAAVLAFSPASGDAMAGCRADRFAPGVEIPALALRPARELQRDATRESFEALAAAGLQTHVPDPGTHGSSTLVSGRVAGDEVSEAAAAKSVAETWAVVTAFLDAHARR